MDKYKLIDYLGKQLPSMNHTERAEFFLSLSEICKWTMLNTMFSALKENSENGECKYREDLIPMFFELDKKGRSIFIDKIAKSPNKLLFILTEVLKKEGYL